MTDRPLTIASVAGQSDCEGQVFITAHDEHGSLVSMTTVYVAEGRLCLTGDPPPLSASPELRRVIQKFEKAHTENANG